MTLIIFLYLVILAWNLFTKKHISIYEVNTSEISDDSPLYAYVLRKEQIVNSDDEGFVNYFIPEGYRVGEGDVVYTLDYDDTLSDMLGTLKNDAKGGAEVSSVREQIETFYNTYSLSSHSQLADFHFRMNSLLLEQSRSNLYKDMKKMLKTNGQDLSYKKYKAPRSGVVSYYTDGYENVSESGVNKDVLDKSGTVERKQVAANGKIVVDEPAYKLVTSNDWSLIAMLDDNYYAALKDLDTVRITINKDGTSFNASIKHYMKDNKHFVKLSTSRFMERYINDRFLRIEFALRSAKGLKIPNSSILTKNYFEIPKDFCVSSDGKMTVIKQSTDEEGNTSVENIDLTSSYSENEFYYIRDNRLNKGDVILAGGGGTFKLDKTKSVEGVYNVNEGFCRFKPVEVMYHNKEYSIVSDTTKDGLNVFDHIVVDPKELNDDDFID
ncbi:MAG: hypothetical protein K5639_08680 [Eubacterium sp.]|nr:hypothetical protein [Eubacterium sp.]